MKIEIVRWKNHPVLHFWPDRPEPKPGVNKKAAMAFGITKAKMILENLETVKEFVAEFDPIWMQDKKQLTFL